jgi:hypothetical protein
MARPVTLEFGGATYAFDPSVDLGEQVNAIRALHERPASEDDAIIPMLVRNANDLSPAFLYELARRLWERDRDQAFEWFAVAFIRSHYDGYRCVDRSAHQGVEYIRAIAQNVMDGSRQARAAYGRAGLRAFARPDVFAGTASPRWICVHGIGAYAASLEDRGQPQSEWLKPELDWAAIQDRLRTEGMRAFQRMSQE